MKEFTGKAIKVGSSLAVTLPARDVKSQNISAGDKIKISYQPVVDSSEVKNIDADYEKFKKVYNSTLKNLADR